MNNKRLGQSALATTPGTLLYTTPSGYDAVIEDIEFANTTAGALSVTLYVVPSGGTLGSGNELFPAVSIPANTLMQWTGSQALSQGDFVQAFGSSAGITVTMSGQEYKNYA